MLNRIFWALIVIYFAIAALGHFQRIDADDAVRQQSEYCEMVNAHRHDPTIGWPDYRHTYQTECKPMKK